MTDSREEPDPRREALRFLEWNPGKRLLRSIRAYQRHRRGSWPWSVVLRWFAVLRHWLWSAVSGADIPLNTQIGIGLLIPHPNGIVIHPRARIGVNCLLFQQVTLGVSDSASGPPELGDHVDVGAGAKILGEIRIGGGARVGANAVVLMDVPARVTVVGVPARVVAGSKGGGSIGLDAD
jgi:serine O-acetyltransferase